MRHGVQRGKLGRRTASRMSMLRGLTTELFRHGKIQTTEAKAKNVRPIAEKLITLAKRGDLHARRLVASRLYDPSVLQKLFGNVSEHFQNRNGGYTRIYKLGPRKGDAAPMALLELVDYDPYAQTKLEG